MPPCNLIARIAPCAEPSTALPPSPMLGAAWARLRRKPRRQKRRDRLCILSDYPAKGGRTGYAVGLDTPTQSVKRSREALAAPGYDVGAHPAEADLAAAELIEAASAGPPFRSARTMSLANYRAGFA